MTFSLSREPTLSRSGHDRAAERRDDASWLAAAWERGRALVVTPDYTAPLVDDSDGPRLALRPCASVPADADRYFLGLTPTSVVGLPGAAGAGGPALTGAGAGGPAGVGVPVGVGGPALTGAGDG
ncbi:MAG TPA: hypothetical protein VE547_16695, partial [Mycobacteriales bacterium]|nr:hypothetical protein [Mycobacteriales bacterium]